MPLPAHTCPCLTSHLPNFLVFTLYAFLVPAPCLPFLPPSCALALPFLPLCPCIVPATCLYVYHTLQLVAALPFPLPPAFCLPASPSLPYHHAFPLALALPLCPCLPSCPATFIAPCLPPCKWLCLAPTIPVPPPPHTFACLCLPPLTHLPTWADGWVPSRLLRAFRSYCYFASFAFALYAASVADFARTPQRLLPASAATVGRFARTAIVLLTFQQHGLPCPALYCLSVLWTNVEHRFSLRIRSDVVVFAVPAHTATRHSRTLNYCRAPPPWRTVSAMPARTFCCSGARHIYTCAPLFPFAHPSGLFANSAYAVPILLLLPVSRSTAPPRTTCIAAGVVPCTRYLSRRSNITTAITVLLRVLRSHLFTAARFHSVAAVSALLFFTIRMIYPLYFVMRRWMIPFVPALRPVLATALAFCRAPAAGAA